MDICCVEGTGRRNGYIIRRESGETLFWIAEQCSNRSMKSATKIAVCYMVCRCLIWYCSEPKNYNCGMWSRTFWCYGGSRAWGEEHSMLLAAKCCPMKRFCASREKKVQCLLHLGKSLNRYSAFLAAEDFICWMVDSRLVKLEKALAAGGSNGGGGTTAAVLDVRHISTRSFADSKWRWKMKYVVATCVVVVTP